jgi:uncharacterized membrane protein
MKPAISTRIESIDLLRGLVIIIMALDHIRDYFHADAFYFDPTDLSQTSPVLFFTRWITHFCAPVFVFLAGTSAYQIGIRKGKPALSSFLLKRGVWIIVLEFTVINFAWFFNIRFEFVALMVIWVLGIGMIFLAGLIYLPRTILLILSLVLIFGHNAFDGFHVEGTYRLGWALLHERTLFHFGGIRLFTAYSIVPWIAVMSLGYCFGTLFTPGFDPVKRRRTLFYSGSLAIGLFILIRLLNIYGDPSAWSTQPSGLYTLLSFLNTTKYPPSLLYLLMTLGPALLFLGWADTVRNKVSDLVQIFGRVPMFFYIVHIYFVHIIALSAALLTGFSLSDMIFDRWITQSEALRGYGFNLAVTYLIWLAVLAVLYPLCKMYDRYKTQHKENWWLSYL